MIKKIIAIQDKTKSDLESIYKRFIKQKVRVTGNDFNVLTALENAVKGNETKLRHLDPSTIKNSKLKECIIQAQQLLIGSKEAALATPFKLEIYRKLTSSISQEIFKTTKSTEKKFPEFLQTLEEKLTTTFSERRDVSFNRLADLKTIQTSIQEYYTENKSTFTEEDKASIKNSFQNIIDLTMQLAFKFARATAKHQHRRTQSLPKLSELSAVKPNLEKGIHTQFVQQHEVKIDGRDLEKGKLSKESISLSLQILGLEAKDLSTNSTQVIKDAIRKMSRRFHPDKRQDVKDATALIQNVNKAAEILGKYVELAGLK